VVAKKLSQNCEFGISLIDSLLFLIKLGLAIWGANCNLSGILSSRTSSGVNQKVEQAKWRSMVIDTEHA